MNPELVSILISLMGVIATWLSVSITVNKGTEENSKQTGMILQSITGLKEDVRDVKADVKDTSAKIAIMENRITKLESFASNDNERIARLEERNK